MQTISAEEYRKRRVRLAGFVRGQGIDAWAGLWMRVDGPVASQHLAFDNMEERPLRATFDWKEVSVVLDVPAEATYIAFGALLTGDGSLQLARLRFEIVDEQLPTTNQVRRLHPRNLDFAEVP